MNKETILAEFTKQRAFIAQEVFCDEVLVAIIQVMDYDLAKSLVPETSEGPEVIPELMDEMRTAAVEAMSEHIMRLDDD